MSQADQPLSTSIARALRRVALNRPARILVMFYVTRAVLDSTVQGSSSWNVLISACISFCLDYAVERWVRRRRLSKVTSLDRQTSKAE
jgi:hypothetical protein